MDDLCETYLMILNYTKISCRDVLRGRWFSTKFSCDFFDFLLRALRLAYENQLRKLMYLPECLFCTASKSASRKAENKENRGAGHGAQTSSYTPLLRKSAPKSPSMRCCVSLLFVMFPAAVFFIILRWLCFSRISRSGEIRCALGNPCAVRNVPCAVISLRAGCVVYLTVRIALRDRSV